MNAFGYGHIVHLLSSKATSQVMLMQFAQFTLFTVRMMDSMKLPPKPTLH